MVQASASLGGKDDVPVFAWDIMGGLIGRNKLAKEAASHVFGERAALAGPADALLALQKGAAVKPFADAIVFFNNPQRMWEQVDIVQGLWNLRDVFKVGGQMLVLVTPPGAVLPVELQNDVMVIDEPLPSADDLRSLIPGLFESAELAAPNDDAVSRAVDALVGLAAFPAEQALAMSLSKKGLDIDRLWERKRQAVEQAPGLTIWRGGETFADIGGCDNIKRFLSAVLTGQEAPRVVVFVDEIEKAFAGTGTDTSGVKTEMTGTILGWMQDRGAGRYHRDWSGWCGEVDDRQGGGEHGRDSHGGVRSFGDAEFARGWFRRATARRSPSRRGDFPGQESLDCDLQLHHMPAPGVAATDSRLGRSSSISLAPRSGKRSGRSTSPNGICRRAADRRRLDRRRDSRVLPKSVAAESIAEGIGRVHRACIAIGGGSDRGASPPGVGAILERSPARRVLGGVRERCDNRPQGIARDRMKEAA
jgi:hypothetical protein